jgi:hypothetical protein
MQEAVLIGLGNIGMGYDLTASGILINQTMTHLKAISDSEFFSVIGVIDSEKSRLSLARDTYSVRAVRSLNEIPSTSEIDLLTIATPTPTHLEVIESIPESMVPRILLIEKPAGNNSQECFRIAQWANSSSTLVFVNYFRRYLPKVKDARDYISALILGKLLSVSINSYGSVLNIFSHFMDLGLAVTGKHLFCSCPKSAPTGAKSNLQLECTKCAVHYSFVGVGRAKVTSKLRICFENYQIDIIDDGMEIIISEPKVDGLISFKTEKSVYMNYQKVVYSAIANFSNDTHFLAGMNQAIEIHSFIESARIGDGE